MKPTSSEKPATAWRKRLAILIIAAALLVGGLAYWRHARQVEGTDDAQVDADISAVSARVPGTVAAVRVTDNQAVTVGDTLVELDPADLAVVVAHARAQLALADAQLGAAESDLQQAVTQSGLAERDRQREEHLVAREVISVQAYDQRASLAATTAAAVQSARKQVEVRHASLDVARADLSQGLLNLGYAHIVAPVSGIVGRKSVAVGDRVQPGQTLLVVTDKRDMWITAFYRETQLERMKLGAPATVYVDAISREYTGHVESFGGATGSRFSLLPPENASGNYVKIVQRIPVRIRLEPGQPDLDQLRPGLSAEPQVRVR